MSKREDVVECARLRIGAVFGSDTYQSILDTYNSITPLPQGYKLKYGDAWCAAFVSAMAKLAGVTDFPYECSCPRMVSLFSSKGQWMEDDGYVPNPGDVIFYDWDDTGSGDNTGTPDHVGIVWECSGESMTIIEGNCGGKVATRFIPVNAPYIRGFGVPDYEDSAPPPAQTAAPAETPAVDNMYIVRPGDGWWKIAAEQLGNGALMHDLAALNGMTIEAVLHPGMTIKLWDDDCPTCKIDPEPLENEEASVRELKRYLEEEVRKLGGTVTWH